MLHLNTPGGFGLCRFPAAIAVSSVVEKGSKDEMLPLSNSGSVRVKSTFILTEEERAKIAAMVRRNTFAGAG